MALGQEAVDAALADWRSSPLPERTRLTLGFLQKITLAPHGVGPEDVAPLRAAGVSDEALADALYVCALFNLIDRVADALGFDVPSAEVFAARAPAFLAEGYGNEG